jgi:hypothetical protein
VDVQDGVGPRVPFPDVAGAALRASSPAPHLDVEIRDPGSGRVVLATASDARGRYAFSGVPAGRWEVKISGAAGGDFASVSREFERAAGQPTHLLPALDVFAFGAAPTAPPDGARLARPSPAQPLYFRWTNPPHPGRQARVLLYDQRGDPVWSSSRFAADSALWNGVGNQGPYSGALVPAGPYAWRIKFDLPDSVQARTALRAMVLQ